MNSDSPSQLPLQQIWARALEQLQLQMSRATFEALLQGTTLTALEVDHVYVVKTKNRFAGEWLANRLLTTIQRVLAGIVGTEVILKFVTDAPDAPTPAPDNVTFVSPANLLAPYDLPFEARLFDKNAVTFIEAVDFEHLWLKTGFTQVPDYAIRYWRTYLGRAFDLWEFLISEDKRDVKKMLQKKIPYWTPARRYSYRSLASVLGCGRPTLTGRLVPCWIYERQKKQARDAGQPLPSAICCGKYQLHQMRPNGQGEIECQHWLEGLLERLYREGLVAVQRIKHRGKPRAHELRLQAWRLVPVLSPDQVAQFNHELDREGHKQWLERYGHLCDFGLPGWEQISAPSLVHYVPGYRWGRELFDVYQNNPLLEEEGYEA